MRSADSITDIRLPAGPLLVWTDLRGRAWQWAQLLDAQSDELKEYHLWIHERGSKKRAQSFERFEDLGQMLGTFDSGVQGAGVVNIAFPESIQEHRSSLNALFERGVVLAHEGDRTTIEALNVPPTDLWFSTRQTKGDADELWKSLRKRLGLRPQTILVQLLHDCANFFRTIGMARHQRPDDPWVEIVDEVRRDADEAGPGSFETSIRSVRVRLQRLRKHREELIASGAELTMNDAEALDCLISSGFGALSGIARVASPIVSGSLDHARVVPKGSDLDADLEIWHQSLDRIGELRI